MKYKTDNLLTKAKKISISLNLIRYIRRTNAVLDTYAHLRLFFLYITYLHYNLLFFSYIISYKQIYYQLYMK